LDVSAITKNEQAQVNESFLNSSKMSARVSIKDKALSLLGAGPKPGEAFPGGKIPFGPYTGNRNLKKLL
jgi:hypothetical protein